MSKKFKLLTSNESKSAEYRRFGLPVVAVKGKDIKEVNADSTVVVEYKALEVDDGEMVEDTVLIVEGEEVVDIRYRMDEFLQKAQEKTLNAEWWVTIAMKDGDVIKIANASVKGVLGPHTALPGEKVFGFDDVFYPMGETKSLHELTKDGRKDEFSARKNAILRFINQDVDSPNGFYKEKSVDKIEPWKGGYQV